MGTPGKVTIPGYGELPNSCKNSLGSTCTITLCKMDKFTIQSESTNGWEFTITGDVGDLIDAEFKDKNSIRQHISTFPTWIDTDEYDSWQTYNFQKIEM